MSFNRHLFLHRVSRRASNRTFSRRFGGRSCQAFLKSLDVSGLWLATLSINSSCRLWGSDLRNWYFNCSSSQFFVLHCTTLKIWMKGARLIGGYAFFLGRRHGKIGRLQKTRLNQKSSNEFHLAERKGFEPLWGCPQTVFKTASLWPLRYLSVYETVFRQKSSDIQLF